MVANRLQYTAESGTRSPQAPAGKGLLDVAADVVGVQTLMVNLYMVGLPGDDDGWVLVDTGLPMFTDRILSAAERRFGPGARPKAIVLTHGHFDHVGCVYELATRWDVPVYAHEAELPYLTGVQDYPPPDPSVGGGLLARMAALYPRRGINLGDRARALPDDGSVPEMPGWGWIHTPGHTPGHVSLYRESDRLLIVGDAFITTKQESALAVLFQYPVVHGPPTYFTTDWEAARESVRRLASLRPMTAATGHGLPMSGSRLEHGLQALARDFDRVAVPRHGRYVPRERFLERGAPGHEVHVPEGGRPGSIWNQPVTQVAAALGLVIGAATLISALSKRRQ